MSFVVDKHPRPHSILGSSFETPHHIKLQAIPSQRSSFVEYSYFTPNTNITTVGRSINWKFIRENPSEQISYAKLIKTQSKIYFDEAQSPSSPPNEIPKDLIEQMAEEDVENSNEVVTKMVNLVHANRAQAWQKSIRLKPKHASVGPSSPVVRSPR